MSRPLLMGVALFGAMHGANAQEQQPKNVTLAGTQIVNTSPTRELPGVATNQLKAESDDENAVGMGFIKNLLADQKEIWTSPARLRWNDAKWLVPFAEVTGGLLATDPAANRAIASTPGRLTRYRELSDAGLASLVAAGGGMYLWSYLPHDSHMKEAGVLAAEAVLDSLAVSTASEYSLGRAQPGDFNSGKFFERGTSFPSEHAAAVWSAASVLTEEYPGPLTEFLAYGTASAVSASRVLGREHFPSDVLVGSAMGWMIGREVYRMRHSVDLEGGSRTETFGSDDEEDSGRDAQNMGSPSVPLDSWVYTALEKLAALGYIKTAMEGLRPWTRVVCAELTEEAAENVATRANSDEAAAEIAARLEREFSYETGLLDGNQNLTASIESIYERGVSISGPALNNFHFGQTLAYDFGRPFERGMNDQAGGAWSAAAGPVAIYIRAEYQHSPAAPALTDAERSVIAERDLTPEAPPIAVEPINRPRLLDSYLAVNLDNWELSLGKQSLIWAPGPGGSLLLSDNAEPIDMARLVNPEPIRLPGFLGFLGPARVDQFFGRLQGHSYHARPFIYGQKINFKPIACLELGFGRTTEIGGVGGDPITLGNSILSVFGQLNHHSGHVPGENNSGMDWTFNVPGVRNYLVLYGEVYAHDDFLAWQNPPENPYRPGIFLTRIPGIAKLDFHAEVASTESPGWVTAGGNHGNLNYWSFTYRDSYINNGNLLGNTVGRMGRAVQCWLRYGASPRNSIEFVYKHNSVSPAFMPQGGYWQDYTAQDDLYLQSGFYLRSEVQFEHISSYPLLFNGTRENVSAILELGFMPDWGKTRRGR